MTALSRRLGRNIGLLLVGVATATLVAACTEPRAEVVTVTVALTTAAPLTTAESTEAAETTAGPIPLSDSDYQARLDRVSARLQRVMSRIVSATSYGQLLGRTGGAAELADEITTRLRRVAPPEHATAAHEQFVSVLATLSANLARTTDAVASRSVCAAPAAEVRLSHLASASKLQAARKALAQAGFSVPRLLPAPLPEENRSLATGHYLVDRASGEGQLTIDNGRARDSVAALTAAGDEVPIIVVYIQAGDRFTVAGIPDGTYRLSFTSGSDWDERLGRFTRRCEFLRFDDQMEFETTATKYTGWEITLHAVAGGTATTTPIDPDKFPAVGVG